MKSILAALILIAFGNDAQALCKNSIAPEGIGDTLDTLSKGDYGKFIHDANKHANASPDSEETFLSQMAEAFPGGFDRCVSLSQEKPSEDYIKEFLVFEREGTFLFVKYVAFRVEDDWIMGNYKVNTSLSQILPSWE